MLVTSDKQGEIPHLSGSWKLKVSSAELILENILMQIGESYLFAVLQINRELHEAALVRQFLSHHKICAFVKFWTFLHTQVMCEYVNLSIRAKSCGLGNYLGPFSVLLSYKRVICWAFFWSSGNNTVRTDAARENSEWHLHISTCRAEIEIPQTGKSWRLFYYYYYYYWCGDCDSSDNLGIFMLISRPVGFG